LASDDRFSQCKSDLSVIFCETVITDHAAVNIVFLKVSMSLFSLYHSW